jgi:dTDP-4-dehydrorhamnose 3,5-epimerase
MSETWRGTAIAGVRRASLTVHADSRGSFSEVWREAWMPELAPGRDQITMHQANLSRSLPRVLRGMHVHERQCDLWIVLDGHPFIAIVDVREVIKGRGPAQVETVMAGPGDAFFLPEGVAHGFYAHDATTLLYLVTNEYDGSDEHGFAWNDAAVGIPWPDAAPVLSERDAAAPPLADLLKRHRRDDQQIVSR